MLFKLFKKTKPKQNKNNQKNHHLQQQKQLLQDLGSNKRTTFEFNLSIESASREEKKLIKI